MVASGHRRHLVVKWFVFQTIVGTIAFWWIGTWADVKGYGAAPGVLALGVAYLTTLLVARLADWRWRRFDRSVRVGEKLQRQHLALPSVRRARQITEELTRSRIGKDVNKLI